MSARKTLVSWLGSRDIAGFAKNGKTDMGPLYSILTASHLGHFQELLLAIDTDPDEDREQSAMKKRALRRLEQLCAELGTTLRVAPAPANLAAASPEIIHEFLLGQLERLYKNARDVDFYYNITSGTSAMCAIQLNLSLHSAYSGNPLYTVQSSWLNDANSNIFSVQLPERLSNLTSTHVDDELYIEPNRKIYDQARARVANTKASVLILGETGTGKSALANHIHKNDLSRNSRPLETLNCATFLGDPSGLLSELFGHTRGAYTGASGKRQGAFQRANGHTLFLDEIGEIPPQIQGLLLRAIETGMIKPYGSDEEIRVDVRIIAATNIDLYSAIKKGAFRSDLFYRIAQYTPRLKSLREYSAAEKEKLLHFLLNKINTASHRLEPRSFSLEAKKLLLAYPWPGNIREMKFRLESICLLSSQLIQADDVAEQLDLSQNRANAVLDEPPQGAVPADALEEGRLVSEDEIPADLPAWLKEREKRWLETALHYYPQHKDAAKRLGMPVSTFNSKWGKLSGKT